MQTPDLTRWNRVWLSRPWAIRPVPGTAQVELNGVRGFLTPGDVVYLFNLGAHLPPGGAYLEVGSWLGLSGIVVANGLLANVNLKAKVFCVDTWRGSAEHRDLPEVRQDTLYAQFLANIREAQVDGLIEPVRGDSAAVARDWRGPALDTVFIDGDHSLEACYADLCGWHARLKSGGQLCGHDAVPGSAVEAAVRRLCRERGLRAAVLPLPECHYMWTLLRVGEDVPTGHEILCG